MRGGGKKDGVSWKRRARKKDVRTKRETTRPQGLLLSFYGHDKWRSKRRRAASGAAVGTEGGRRSSLGKRLRRKREKKKMVIPATLRCVDRGAMQPGGQKRGAGSRRRGTEKQCKGEEEDGAG